MLDCTGQILVLTGSPGSGKTTAARALVNLPGSAKVHLHADDFWHAIGQGAVAPFLPAAHAQNAVVMEALAAAAYAYARGGYFVVVDGIVGPWFLPAFRRDEAVVHYVVLSPPLDEAIRRCQARGGDTLTDAQVIAALHGQLADLGEFLHHGLPTAGLDVDGVVAAVVQAVESERFRLARAAG
ncbi:shikimate kinase [Bosea sp. Root483D1]|uniref:AAA family ATPase n=1 Tax=Bosea sp. Root483D1 TaxID=1736544 RepID=UPI00070F1E13|nr:AAA family ATPase [Bosea sp. Root483D1]KRE13125.1 shikimate kinase [Bosea sp. Root483D1]